MKPTSIHQPSPHWSSWERCSQWFHPSRDYYEIKRSFPYGMIVALLLFGAGINFLFNLWLPSSWADTRFLSAALCLLLSVALFPLGKGTIIDGTRRKVQRWWGWIPKPMIRFSYDFSFFSSVKAEKKLGIKQPATSGINRMGGISSGPRQGGQDVWFPVFLITTKGKRICIMRCHRPETASALASEVGRIMSISVQNDLSDYC